MTVMAAPVLERKAITPYRAVTKTDFRWGRGDIKVTSLIANGLLKNEALAEGYDDAILIRDGDVTEATAANVFIVSDGCVVTPPKSPYLLHGITRDHVVNLARGASPWKSGRFPRLNCCRRMKSGSLQPAMKSGPSAR